MLLNDADTYQASQQGIQCIALQFSDGLAFVSLVFLVFLLLETQGDLRHIQFSHKGVSSCGIILVFETSDHGQWGYLLSPKLVRREVAVEETYEGKAMSSITTSRRTLECARSPSISLKIRNPDSIRNISLATLG